MTTPTINLDGAKIVDNNDDYTILDENNIRYLFGGRYTSDEYVKMDKDGKEESVHIVRIELVCDHDQFINLIKTSNEKGRISVQLV